MLSNNVIKKSLRNLIKKIKKIKKEIKVLKNYVFSCNTLPKNPPNALNIMKNSSAERPKFKVVKE